MKEQPIPIKVLAGLLNSRPRDIHTVAMNLSSKGIINTVNSTLNETEFSKVDSISLTVNHDFKSVKNVLDYWSNKESNVVDGLKYKELEIHLEVAKYLNKTLL